MSASPLRGRQLTFEVGEALYALPIEGVREVADVGLLACIPTLDPRLGGVTNHHGDALPVFRRSVLLDLEEATLPAPGHLLVISDPVSGAARLGLPVDRVLGLVDGEPPGNESAGHHRSVDGRVAKVLDPRQLLARVQQVIERSLARGDS